MLATGLAGDREAGMSRPRVCPWSDWARGPERVSCHGCGTLCPEEWLQCSVDPSRRPELDTPRDSVGSHLWPWSPERSALARPLVRAGQLSGVSQPGRGAQPRPPPLPLQPSQHPLSGPGHYTWMAGNKGHSHKDKGLGPLRPGFIAPQFRLSFRETINQACRTGPASGRMLAR